MEQLTPQVVETTYTVGKERPTEGNALGKNTIREMSARGYRWTLLIFRIQGVPAVRFAVNLASVPDMSSGSLFFFKDYHLFEQAYRWSQTVLPRFQHAENEPK
jgi:hypothetical protein